MPSRLLNLALLAFMPLALASCVVAQEAGGRSKQAPADRVIEMGRGAALAGLPFTGAVASPFTCSSSGQVYVGEYAVGTEGRFVSTIPDLYRVSPLGQVKHLTMPMPTGYASIDRLSFFSGENALVALIGASQPIDENGKSGPLGGASFLSATDADGDHARLIRLNLDFDPVQAAVFATDEFLVVGTAPATFEPSIALLDRNGQLIRYVDIFPQKAGDDGANAKQDTAGAQVRKPASVLTGSMVRLAPWGSDILLVLPGIDGSAVYHFRASGQFERIPIQLPSDQSVLGILGSGGRENWVILTRSSASMTKFSQSRVVENPEDSLYEVSSHSGETLNRLLVHGPRPGEVACAADGKLTALWVWWPDGAKAPDGFVFASVLR